MLMEKELLLSPFLKKSDAREVVVARQVNNIVDEAKKILTRRYGNHNN